MQAEHPEPVQEAIQYLEQNQVHEAILTLFPFARRNSQNTEGLFWLGVALARIDRNRDSCRVLGRTVEIDPSHARAFRNLGHHRLLAEDPAGAEPFLRLAHSLDPNSRLVRSDLGSALSDLGRADESRIVLEEAVAANPDDLLVMSQLMLLERSVGANEHAREWADRILSYDDLNEAMVRWVLVQGIETQDSDLARQAAQRFFDAGQVDPLGDVSLLIDVATAFPPDADHLLRGEPESVTCPACGHAANYPPIRGMVFDNDPLARLSTLGGAFMAGRCPACEFYLPDTVQTVALWPDLSIAILVDGFPGKQLEVGQPAPVVPGSFNEPKSAHPKGESWFTIPITCVIGTAVSTFIGDMTRELEGNLPRIGEFGRAERRAQELSAMLRAFTGCPEAAELKFGDEPPTTGVPDWMLLERRMLLDAGVPARPWHLDHRCSCGADLTKFMFGEDLSRTYDAAVVDAAAIEGKPFADPVSGTTMLGFNCDACGVLHTWVLGVVPGID